MGKNANVLAMKNSVVEYVKANLPKDKNKAHFGRVQGDCVIIGNKSYSYIPAVDLYFSDGDSVACILPDSGNVAAIVGVL